MLVIVGHILEYLCKTREYPAVAACPEVLFALMTGVSVQRITITRGPEAQIRIVGGGGVACTVRKLCGCCVSVSARRDASGTVVHELFRVLELYIELVKILFVARNLVELCHNGHNHVKGVSPPPVGVDGAISLIAHNLERTRNLGGVNRCTVGFVLLYIVQINIGLEANLEIAEKNRLVRKRLAVAVCPLACRSCGGVSHPAAVVCPRQSVFAVRLDTGCVVGFHITCLVSSLSPEAVGNTILLLVVLDGGLVIIVCAFNSSDDFVIRRGYSALVLGSRCNRKDSHCRQRQCGCGYSGYHCLE